jgi:hypothetical protein
MNKTVRTLLKILGHVIAILLSGKGEKNKSQKNYGKHTL